MKSVVTKIEAGIGVVTLNRPERHNAFDDETIAALIAALAEVAVAPEARVIVLAATGKSFSAGADLDWMKRAASYGEDENLRDAMQLATLMQRLQQLPKPTIARIQGSAYGGGVGLIAACDIAVAVADCRFSLPEVRLGLVPAVIAPYVIAALGERQARRYMLTAERFDTAQAHRLGLVHEIAAGEADLDATVARIARSLHGGGPDAQAACKALIGRIARRPLDDDVIADTARTITAARAGAEGKEGMAAFLQRRQPRWAPEN
jgi:methylglutaconyl-CoA hydratase